MFVLYYSNAKYLFLQTRNGLFEDSRVLGELSPLVTPTKSAGADFEDKQAPT